MFGKMLVDGIGIRSEINDVSGRFFCLFVVTIRNGIQIKLHIRPIRTSIRFKSQAFS